MGAIDTLAGLYVPRGYGTYKVVMVFVLQQQHNLGRRFGTSKMHLSPPVA